MGGGETGGGVWESDGGGVEVEEGGCRRAVESVVAKGGRVDIVTDQGCAEGRGVDAELVCAAGEGSESEETEGDVWVGGGGKGSDDLDEGDCDFSHLGLDGGGEGEQPDFWVEEEARLDSGDLCLWIVGYRDVGGRGRGEEVWGGV